MEFARIRLFKCPPQSGAPDCFFAFRDGLRRGVAVADPKAASVLPGFSAETVCRNLRKFYPQAELLPATFAEWIEQTPDAQ